MKTIYLVLYQSIFQYGLLVWGSLTANALSALQLQ